MASDDDPKFPISEQNTDELFQFFSDPQQEQKDEHDLTHHLSEDGNVAAVGKRKTAPGFGFKQKGNIPSHEGKRSISDHMHEAVNYIKHLQNRITELSDKRDELKRRSTITLHKPKSLTECTEEEDSQVEVRACFVGVEVVIKTGLRRSLLLSKVLEVLFAEGLNVVSCVSTSNVNERMLHTIISEVNDDQGSIELSELQKKLTEVINENLDQCPVI
ncbi:hypothetical protein CCACVL1_07699 [Corchorus capsularis]|uniref:BHLH domain-containing protein n=1 Tax=Corchorus capsularis TaxID=210143 RepID=A0A1R3J4A3_COCAP|nr:hypothetical protein CCACVL1_07699 [Corchorus capsularis]